MFELTLLLLAIILNPAVTRDNIDKTICVPNWTATIRPSTYTTNKIKKQKMLAVGIPWDKRGEYELDHIVSLSSGGSPTNPNNMMLQKWTGEWNARMKDRVEVYLHKQVCTKKMDLKTAQIQLYLHWKDVYLKITK